MSLFGIALFLIIGGMAFWLLFFLLFFIVPYWISLGIFDKMRPKKIFDEETQA
jgi:Na+-transporting methylmalonyl-CoA/oxaloacetate decarboxylase gamma subunit